MFIHFDGEQDEYNREPDGVAVTHVDDIMSAGDTEFESEVMNGMKKSFEFGSEEEQEFRYVGMNIVQYDQGIEMDNNHYIDALELPNMEVVKHLTVDQMMESAGQTEFRSVVGKLTSLAHSSRPDICFDVKVLSSKFGRATKRDL